MEKTEEEAAALITEYALRQDSGGAGEWRGGTGVVFSVRIAREGSAVLGRGMERFMFRPWGMAGGKPGEKARVVLNLGTPAERELGKLDIFHPKPGDVVTILTPGGGGYGDPLKRPPERVHDDMIKGYISRAAAERDYGVVFASTSDGADAAIDAAATQRRRAEFARARGAVKDFDFGPERDAWDAVFDDATMLRLNAALMQIGVAARSQRRREIFERVVPALADRRIDSIDRAVGDVVAARARLADELVRLERDLAQLRGAA
jgi:N-methylhydantoinase B